MTDPAGASTVQTRGLDVSHHQGTVDWRQVRQAGYAFAFIKATDGITYVDPMFAANWDGAKSAGLLRGAYHFFEADDDPRQQAESFLKTVTLAAGDLPPVLDVEASASGSQVPAATVVERVAAWLQAVQQATGRTPILYTDNGYWNSLGTTRFSGYPLWIANYGVASPTLPAGWTSWAFWQYTENGTIPGITGAVDLNLYRGGPQDLAALAASAAPAPRATLPATSETG